MQKEQTKDVDEKDKFMSDEEAERLVEADEKFGINGDGSYVSVVRDRYREAIRNSHPVDVVDVKVSRVVDVADDSVTVEFEVEGEEYSLKFSEDGNPSIRDLFSVTGCSSFSELYGRRFKTLLGTDGEPLLKQIFVGSEGRLSLYAKRFQIFLSERGIFRRTGEGYPHPRSSEGELTLSWSANLLFFVFSVFSIICTVVVTSFSVPFGLFLGILLAILWIPALAMSLGMTYNVLLKSD